MFDLLENILIDKRKAHDVLSGAQIVEGPTMCPTLISDGSQLSKKSYYEYNQFLKTSSNFSAFLSEDGLKQLGGTLVGSRAQS